MSLSEIADLATALSLIVAVFIYTRDRIKNQKQRELEAHIQATQQWREIIHLCISNSELKKYVLFGMPRGKVSDKHLLFELYGILMAYVFLLERREKTDTVDNSWFIGWKRLFHHLANDPEFDSFFCTMEKFYDEKFTEWYIQLRSDKNLSEWHKRDAKISSLNIDSKN